MSSKTISFRRRGRKPHPLKAEALALAAETLEESGEPKYTLAQIAEKLELNPSTVRVWAASAQKEV